MKKTSQKKSHFTQWDFFILIFAPHDLRFYGVAGVRETREPPYTEGYVRWCERSVDELIIYLLGLGFRFESGCLLYNEMNYPSPATSRGHRLSIRP